MSAACLKCSWPKSLCPRPGPKANGLLLRRRAALGYALLFGTNFGVQFTFISGSSLVFIGHFGLSARIYGLIFAAASAGIVLAPSPTRSSRGVVSRMARY